jgi:hypothetical protein
MENELFPIIQKQARKGLDDFWDSLQANQESSDEEEMPELVSVDPLENAVRKKYSIVE